ncbi:hypothetical protein V2G26_013122 [Clonostachys chloroleuca]
MNVPGCRSRSLWQPLLLLVLDEDGDEHMALEIASATADETVMTVLVSHVFKCISVPLQKRVTNIIEILNPHPTSRLCTRSSFADSSLMLTMKGERHCISRRLRAASAPAGSSS